MCMLEFLLILCFIGVVAYLIFFFLLPCIKLFIDGEESELYKKISNEIVDYCKEKDIDLDDDMLYQQIYLIVKAITFIIVAIIVIMFALLWLAI